MRIWSWTVEDWNAAFQILTTLFVAGTVLTGLGVFVTGRILTKRQAQELAAARTSMAKVETDLAKQQERAANAERQLLEVQERFRPRTLSQREQNDLFGLLRAYSFLARQAREKNRETLWIVHPSGDAEATEFASMLAGLFVSAGWTPNLRAVPLSTHVVGLEIMVNDPRNPPLLAQTLQKVLDEAHMPYVLRQQESSDNRTWFVVGSKQ